MDNNDQIFTCCNVASVSACNGTHDVVPSVNRRRDEQKCWQRLKLWPRKKISSRSTTSMLKYYQKFKQLKSYQKLTNYNMLKSYISEVRNNQKLKPQAALLASDLEDENRSLRRMRECKVCLSAEVNKIIFLNLTLFCQIWFKHFFLNLSPSLFII